MGEGRIMVVTEHRSEVDVPLRAHFQVTAIISVGSSSNF